MSLIGQKPEVYCTGITHITGYHEYYDEKKKKKNECWERTKLHHCFKKPFFLPKLQATI